MLDHFNNVNDRRFAIGNRGGLPIATFIINNMTKLTNNKSSST